MQLNIVFVHFVFIIVSGNGCKGDIFPLTGRALTRGEDHVGHEVKLPPYIQFPFGGSRYNSLYVSKDGLVGFHPYTLHKADNLLKYLTRDVPAFVAPLYLPAQDCVMCYLETYNSTFQLAMLTDDYKSFAIFNYINVDIQRNPYYQGNIYLKKKYVETGYT